MATTYDLREQLERFELVEQAERETAISWCNTSRSIVIVVLSIEFYINQFSLAFQKINRRVGTN